MVAAVDNRSDCTTIQCRMCSRKFLIIYNREDMLHWISGQDFIQYCMPYLSDSERELLISGTCGDCFDLLFPPDAIDSDI